ncbi:hypothetical protein HPB49_007175 [Dermacentor silvarum]|uniref:Uncharacterized protein n=1 Tax=Dermacentor silvarum TaxID=543639 RepID=A0ACB8CVU7_DERSI|nr:hypothetical protein HPB49_007175 [Dermacentor silvarum]
MAALVTFEGTKHSRFLFYHCLATYVRPYNKTIPACPECSTIGHLCAPNPTRTSVPSVGPSLPKASPTTVATPRASSATVLMEPGLEDARANTGSSRRPRHILEGSRHHHSTTRRVPDRNNLAPIARLTLKKFRRSMPWRHNHTRA